ncbi:MAG TPA: MerR family transcriptional regulator, partial [Ardenticatenaceae bacterium]
MKPEETYYANEFASLAGVTRRTLHYYDEAGLLKPSLYTDANHRLYQREDLLRLQQILTLKRMGFSLAEIRRLLSSPAYDVRQSLRIQKEAIEQQIKQLRQAARALEQTLAALESSEPREWDWEQVIHIIQGVALEDTRRWVERYYTAEQMVRLEERAKGISREQMEQWQQEWSDLIAAFKAKRNLPP